MIKKTLYFIILEPFYSTPHNRTLKNNNNNKKRSICELFILIYFDNILFLAHGSTVNTRSNIPIANIVVPREHF